QSHQVENQSEQTAVLNEHRGHHPPPLTGSQSSWVTAELVKQNRVQQLNRSGGRGTYPCGERCPGLQRTAIDRCDQPGEPGPRRRILHRTNVNPLPTSRLGCAAPAIIVRVCGVPRAIWVTLCGLLRPSSSGPSPILIARNT